MDSINLIVADGDSESLRESVKRFQAMQKIRVLAATEDGGELIQMLGVLQADVLLTGLLLKKVDGFGVLEALGRMKGEKPQTLVLSSVSRNNMIETALSLGACYYMLKPADPQLLYRRICQLAGENGRARAQADAEMRCRERVQSALRQMGIVPAIKGHRYLLESALLGVADTTYFDHLTRRLYPEVARRCGTTSFSVERAIRTAIQSAWKLGGFLRYMNGVPGCEFLCNKPSAGRLIEMLAHISRAETIAPE